jgi:hypothetical protein
MDKEKAAKGCHYGGEGLWGSRIFLEASRRNLRLSKLQLSGCMHHPLPAAATAAKALRPPNPILRSALDRLSIDL